MLSSICFFQIMESFFPRQAKSVVNSRNSANSLSTSASCTKFMLTVLFPRTLLHNYSLNVSSNRNLQSYLGSAGQLLKCFLFVWQRGCALKILFLSEQ